MFSCYLCEPAPSFGTAGALRQHHSIQHKHPIACVEMTCPAIRIEHAYGDSMCGYTFDPVNGVDSKEPIHWHAGHTSKVDADTNPNHLEYPQTV